MLIVGSILNIEASFHKHIFSHFKPLMSNHNPITFADIIDYAGEIGLLLRILQDYYNIALPVFEKYMNECIVDGRACYINETNLGKYEVVCNSAIFKHINSLVKDDGMLIIHTVVRQNIPKNPNWFYVSPVHCAFHTNDSMQILMKQWGYTQSLYSPIAKSWIWFKKNNKHCIDDNLQKFAMKINKELEMKYFYHKKRVCGLLVRIRIKHILRMQ